MIKARLNAQGDVSFKNCNSIVYIGAVKHKGPISLNFSNDFANKVSSGHLYNRAQDALASANRAPSPARSAQFHQASHAVNDVAAGLSAKPVMQETKRVPSDAPLYPEFDVTKVVTTPLSPEAEDLSVQVVSAAALQQVQNGAEEAAAPVVEHADEEIASVSADLDVMEVSNQAQDAAPQRPDANIWTRLLFDDIGQVQLDVLDRIPESARERLHMDVWERAVLDAATGQAHMAVLDRVPPAARERLDVNIWAAMVFDTSSRQVNMAVLDRMPHSVRERLDAGLWANMVFDISAGQVNMKVLDRMPNSVRECLDRDTKPQVA